jgi:hypothetical protein
MYPNNAIARKIVPYESNSYECPVQNDDNPSFRKKVNNQADEIFNKYKSEVNFSNKKLNVELINPKIISEAGTPISSLNLAASDEEAQAIKDLLEYFEENNSDEFENYLKSHEITIEKLSLPSLKRLFASNLESPLILLLQKNNNNFLLDRHLEYRVEKFIENHKTPKNLVFITNYFIEHGVVLREIANKPHLIKKLKKSSQEDVIEKYLKSVALSMNLEHLKEISSQLLDPKIPEMLRQPVPNLSRSPFQSELQFEHFGIDLLSFHGISLEQILTSLDSIKILVQNPLYRKLFITQGKDKNLQSLLKICWEYIANRAKCFSDFNDIKALKKYFETFGDGLLFEDFSKEYPNIFTKNKSSDIYSPNLAASDEEAQAIKDLLEYFEVNNSYQFENYLKSYEITIEKLSLPSLKRLFSSDLEIPLILLLQKNNNNSLLDRHLEYRVEKFIEHHKIPKNLIFITNYFIEHGVVLREIANKSHLIEKLKKSSHKDIIEKYLERVALSMNLEHLKEISSQFLDPKIPEMLRQPLPNLSWSPFQSELQYEHFGIDLLSFHGIALEQIIACSDSIKILVQNPLYRKLFITYAKNKNLRPLLKKCWKYIANRAKTFSDSNDIEALKKYFENLGDGLHFEDFSEKYPDMFKSSENKSHELLVQNAKNIAKKHAREGQDLVSILKLHKFREDLAQLKKETLKIMFQNHSDKTTSGNNEIFIAASELRDLLNKDLYDFYLKEFQKAS